MRDLLAYSSCWFGRITCTDSASERSWLLVAASTGDRSIVTLSLFVSFSSEMSFMEHDLARIGVLQPSVSWRFKRLIQYTG